MSGNASVMGRVLGIAVAKIVLHSAQVVTLVGEIVAAAAAAAKINDIVMMSLLHRTF
jgi:hypothetical protein